MQKCSLAVEKSKEPAEVKAMQTRLLLRCFQRSWASLLPGHDSFWVDSMGHQHENQPFWASHPSDVLSMEQLFTTPFGRIPHISALSGCKRDLSAQGKGVAFQDLPGPHWDGHRPDRRFAGPPIQQIATAHHFHADLAVVQQQALVLPRL